MVYKLGNYMWKNFILYKRVFWLLYKKIDNTLYGYGVGVRKVNELCGIRESVDTSSFIKLSDAAVKNGTYLVNFKRQSNFFNNDPLPAEVTTDGNTVEVQWINGYRCKTTKNKLNFFLEK